VADSSSGLGGQQSNRLFGVTVVVERSHAKNFPATLQFGSSFPALVIERGNRDFALKDFGIAHWGCTRATAILNSTNRADGQPHSTLRGAAGAIGSEVNRGIAGSTAVKNK